MEPERRTRLATIGVLLLVFVSGLLVGLAVERTLLAEAPSVEEEDRERHRDEGRGREGDRGLVVDRVDLGPEQRARVDSIVGSFRSGVRALREEARETFEPRYDALVDSTRTAIRAVMTAEQVSTYDSLLAEADRRRSERHRDARDGGDGR